ncbi:MAG: PA2779 family protein [Betaproteobacteria bacterium]|nr:PA2779 family protein [Betaproteobacteria bacterium]MDH5211019.1 PA2779 family protein [Betaproteobacteria bacterium]MDH5577765.1 PA2779 family protein [Betaproteobacteria bacterium]
MSRFRRMVAGMVIVCLGSTGLVLPAHAGIVSSEALVAGTQQERLAGLLERSDVRARLQAYGVDPAQAQARVAALSDEEAARLAAQIDELPAGGDVLGVALIVFLVLLFTDIMGYTKIFPFTRSTR